ncbi:MAG: ATP-binding cassette domain-containing protein [Marinilabiliales bacterium]|nr:ATP-binding cassette domain-containing protein [Marinilabiliales bacterium]
MIEIKNINKSFENRPILKDVTTLFEKGKTNLIIGQSGSGKTVLLKSIVRLIEVDSGEILFDGRDIRLMSFRDLQQLRQEMGMVFQGGALFDSLSVAENVRFPMDMFTTMSAAEKARHVDFCLDRVNIKGAHKLFPSEISGGMRKRVAIARAIALNPRYLFCDEPNSGLDPVTSILIDNLIHEITEEFNITTLVNTHDMNSVMEIGDNILFISGGEKGWEGNNTQILFTRNKKLNEFVFASPFSKRIRDLKQREDDE